MCKEVGSNALGPALWFNKGRGRAGKATQQWLSRKVEGRQTNGQLGGLKTSQMNTSGQDTSIRL
ncbi:hypothetical protein IFM47457_01403 [Aspergillus lentulus]|nr:hypothetical protein IFM47457_01403 [Aspergillus lentulus]